MNLISYHMLKTLIVGRTKENHNFQLFAREAVIHDLVSMPLIT